MEIPKALLRQLVRARVGCNIEGCTRITLRDFCDVHAAPRVPEARSEIRISERKAPKRLDSLFEKPSRKHS